MQQRILGRTGRPVSVVGLGTWQLGADWGDVSEETAHEVLAAAVEAGVDFFDTADVYGDGRSEQLIARFLGQNPGTEVFVATKMGRRVEQLRENYVMDNFRAWTDRSRKNLAQDTLDLVQLHCPPSAVVESGEVFDALDTLVEEGVMKNYGVSVETCDQALTAIARPAVASVQIILNAFRQKPLDQVLPAAAAAGVGIIARVPLASGLLTGKFTRDTAFAANDHRNYNREGAAFDQGETFSGVDYATGLRAAAEFTELAAALPFEATAAQAALAWIWQLPGVTTVIPGASSAVQARANAAAGLLPELPASFSESVAGMYNEFFRAAIHGRW
ncbi:MAG: aldo/keto reductase [Promicromonosporaceae bacterium]|nr:aldo/keto reductase [Promicromonosporaceae bacterium]